jgi:regulator of nucleoside diphosphate kinase
MWNHAQHALGFIVDVVGQPRTDRLLVTEPDAVRLSTILARRSRDAAAVPDASHLLAAALEGAVVVSPDVMPPDVVTMRSRVVLKDFESGRRREVVLVYPEEERRAVGRISVLSPVGTALLGLSEGTLVEWPLPSGRTAVLRVDEVQYQPEAAEEFHL